MRMLLWVSSWHLSDSRTLWVLLGSLMKHVSNSPMRLGLFVSFTTQLPDSTRGSHRFLIASLRDRKKNAVVSGAAWTGVAHVSRSDCLQPHEANVSSGTDLTPLKQQRGRQGKQSDRVLRGFLGWKAEYLSVSWILSVAWLLFIKRQLE